MRGFIVSFGGVLVVSCGVFGSADDSSPPPSTDQAEAGAPAPPLDGTPKQDEITEAFGVFVTAGATGGDGTRAKPYGTIAEGLQHAVEQHKRVYVCRGSFQEQIHLESGISIVGGFDCSGPAWSTTNDRTKVQSPFSPAIIAEGITSPTRFEGFDVTAPDAKEPGKSSFALLARQSGSLTIVRSRLAAGNGAAGAPGTEGVQLTLSVTTAAGSSNTENTNAPPPSAPFYQPYIYGGAIGAAATCAGAQGFTPEMGGKGGSGGAYVCDAPVVIGGTTIYEWRVYSSGNVTFGPGDGYALTGAAGGAGTDGASADGIGTFDPLGYTPMDGAAGTNGGVGHGGKGGNGAGMATVTCTQNDYGASSDGAGGGAGGCPGLAGTPGKGGGASVAALVLSSAGITFDGSELVGAAGGAGGAGTVGSSATAGSAGGTATAPATTPGAGGPGGRAGVSGSGSGGPSIALAYTGGDPNVTNGTALTPGAGGAGVPERTTTDAVGNAKKLTASAAGLAKDRYAF